MLLAFLWGWFNRPELHLISIQPSVVTRLSLPTTWQSQEKYGLGDGSNKFRGTILDNLTKIHSSAYYHLCSSNTLMVGYATTNSTACLLPSRSELLPCDHKSCILISSYSYHNHRSALSGLCSLAWAHALSFCDISCLPHCLTTGPTKQEMYTTGAIMLCALRKRCWNVSLRELLSNSSFRFLYSYEIRGQNVVKNRTSWSRYALSRCFQSHAFFSLLASCRAL